jgi:hypothetical protein
METEKAPPSNAAPRFPSVKAANWVKEGNCPYCGAPVYMPMDVVFNKEAPPAASFTCNCRNRSTWPVNIPTVITPTPSPSWPQPFYGPWYTVSTSSGTTNP